MSRVTRWALAVGFGLAALAGAMAPERVAAHAALERSEPAAGTSLAEPPAEIRITFTEPLESAYTGAELLDGAGEPVPDVAVSIAPEHQRELVLAPASPLAEGNYTVAWRTLSTADGHTLQGYFGFAVGVEASGATIAAPGAGAGSDALRALSRGLSLLGLAAVLAFAPLALAVFDPAMRDVPGLGASAPAALRRYAVLASALAVLGSFLVLGAQAATIFPDTAPIEAVSGTLGGTRYGQLWLTRLLLLAIVIATVAAASWGRASWRRPALLAGAVVAVVAPLPFSLNSHAAALQEGRTAAVAADALHLLAASIWAGGLFMLAAALLPALRPLPTEERRLALRAVLPRFSVIGLAAWGVLALSGLYAAWLQVGTVEALRTTAYGQSLALKLALLVPVLGLAALHLTLGKRGEAGTGVGRVGSTIAAEALIVVVVLLVVGRLIGLEPAREALSARTPTHLVVPLAFAADDGRRTGVLTISPGAAGPNAFLLEIAGDPLPPDAEGVLRFTPKTQSLGTQELVLPMGEPNVFRAEGSELAVPDDWRVRVIVRAIGDFAWGTEVVIPVGQSPPVQEPNPAPLFAPLAVLGMLALAVGALALAAAVAGSDARPRQAAAAVVGVVAVAAGGWAVLEARISRPEPVLAAPIAATPEPAASPAAMDHETHHESMDHHATPKAGGATPVAPPGPGTAVQGDGLRIALEAAPTAAGPVEAAVTLSGDDGEPIEGARVVILSDMPGMAMGRTETLAEETTPGRYVAEFVPLGMAGEWHLAVRVSPRTAATQVFTFAVVVP